MLLQPKTLAARLTRLLIVMLLVITGVFGLATYWLTKSLLQDSALSGLEALATTKQTALKERLGDFLRMQRSIFRPSLDARVIGLIEAEGEVADSQRDALRRTIQKKIAAETCLDQVEVADAEGNVFLASQPAQEGTSVLEKESFRKGLQRDNLSGMAVEHGNIHVLTSAPVRNSDGDTMAVVLLHFHAKKILAITGEYTGLGRTGETVLGVRRGDAIHFVSPLRFDPTLSNIEPAPVEGKRASPMIHATFGQSGTTYASDYRDVQVVAAYRPLDLIGWGMVVKQDLDEIFSAAVQLRHFHWVAVVLMVAVGLASIPPVVNRFVKPVQELVEATGSIAEGHMDVKMVEGGTDELRLLAASFNIMAVRLRETRAELLESNDTLSMKAFELSIANEEMEEFINSISHDLKTPVLSVLGLADLLKKDLGPDLSEKSKTYLTHIDESTRRMGQLIDELLEMSRIGRIDTLAEQIETGPIVEQVVSELKPLLTDRQVEFVISPDLPEVFCNRKRLYQIMSNLVGNAVKFTAGVEQTQIEIGWEKSHNAEEPEATVLFVRDNGPGIPVKDQERIFALFQRLHGRDVPGTGLGLALVKRVLETMNGSVRVKSRPGHGATFFITIPDNATSR